MHTGCSLMRKLLPETVIMNPMIPAFLIWSACSALFVIIGILSRKNDKPAGFFANVSAPEVTDVKAYNKAVSGLWIGSAVLFELLGTLLLFLKQNPLCIVILMLGTIALVLGMVMRYLYITDRYKK